MSDNFETAFGAAAMTDWQTAYVNTFWSRLSEMLSIKKEGEEGWEFDQRLMQKCTTNVLCSNPV